MEAQTENKYADGLIVKAPRQDFLKGHISIKREDLMKWLSGETEEWINLDIKESRDGKWYAQVNEWKPENALDKVPF